MKNSTQTLHCPRAFYHEDGRTEHTGWGGVSQGYSRVSREEKPKILGCLHEGCLGFPEALPLLFYLLKHVTSMRPFIMIPGCRVIPLSHGSPDRPFGVSLLSSLYLPELTLTFLPPLLHELFPVRICPFPPPPQRSLSCGKGSFLCTLTVPWSQLSQFVYLFYKIVSYLRVGAVLFYFIVSFHISTAKCLAYSKCNSIC